MLSVCAYLAVTRVEDQMGRRSAAVNRVPKAGGRKETVLFITTSKRTRGSNDPCVPVVVVQRQRQRAVCVYKRHNEIRKTMGQ